MAISNPRGGVDPAQNRRLPALHRTVIYVGPISEHKDHQPERAQHGDPRKLILFPQARTL